MAPTPNRLFRIDTALDLVCASQVASTLPPGRDVLAVCLDAVHGDRTGFRASIAALEQLHPWAAVVDVTDLPANAMTAGGRSVAGRVRRARETAEAADLLRARLAPAFEVEAVGAERREALDAAVDEAYFTCITHPGVQALYQVLPSARKAAYPHGFGSFTSLQVEMYAPFFDGPAPSLRHRLVDGLKRVVLGTDAVPRRRYPLDVAYYYDAPAPWAAENVSVAHLESRAEAERVFHLLPEATRQALAEVAARCGPRTLLLLNSPPDLLPGRPADLVRTHAELAASMVRAHDADTILLKPHPRSDRSWDASIAESIGALVPGVAIEWFEESEYPVQILLVPFDVLAVGAVMSTALRDLGKVFGMTAYCPVDRLRAVWSDSPERLEAYLTDYRPYYEPI